MAHTVVFLRALNVGGHGVIRMADLAELFARCGAKNPRTFIQSGNVLLDAAPARIVALAAAVEAQLASKHGISSRVIWRTLDELRALVAAEPFAAFRFAPESKPQVMFLPAPPAQAVALPMASARGDVELLALRGADLLLLTHPQVKPGGDVDALARKAFGATGTTRAFGVLQRLLDWAA